MAGPSSSGAAEPGPGSATHPSARIQLHASNRWRLFTMPLPRHRSHATADRQAGRPRPRWWGTVSGPGVAGRPARSRWPSPCPTPRSPPPPPPPPRPRRSPPTGWSPPTAGCSPSAAPGSTVPPATSISTSRSSAWPGPPTARGTGWWPRTAASSPSGSRVPRVHRRHRAQQAGRRHGHHPGRGRVLAGGLGRRHLRLRRRRLLRVDGRPSPQQARRGHGGHPGRQGLLAGGLGRRHLLLR